MPIDLAALTAEVAPAALPVHGDILNVIYRPGVYTPAFAAAASAEVGPIDAEGKPVNRDQAGSDKFVRMVCDLIVSWDLQATKSSKVPLSVTPANVAKVPMAFLGEVMFQLGVAMRPNRATGSSSGGGSRPVASLEAPPNGTGSFEPVGTTG